MKCVYSSIFIPRSQLLIDAVEEAFQTVPGQPSTSDIFTAVRDAEKIFIHLISSPNCPLLEVVPVSFPVSEHQSMQGDGAGSDHDGGDAAVCGKSDSSHSSSEDDDDSGRKHLKRKMSDGKRRLKNQQLPAPTHPSFPLTRAERRSRKRRRDDVGFMCMEDGYLSM